MTNVLSSVAITIADSEITIDACLLATKLGLSAEVLKVEIRRGNVRSVTEQGYGADAGRTRLTFRYRTCSWCAVVESDGTVIEGPAPENKASAATKRQMKVLNLMSMGL